jgi:hypothetical protein
MEITTADIVALQREAGEIENDLRLRAIIAERRIRELEAKLAVFLDIKKAKDSAEAEPSVE